MRRVQGRTAASWGSRGAPIIPQRDPTHAPGGACWGGSKCATLRGVTTDTGAVSDTGTQDASPDAVVSFW